MQTPKTYSREAKKIRSMLSEHDAHEILEKSLKYLYAPVNNEEERLRRQPWIVLLVIKWAFLEQYNVYHPIRRLTDKRFREILKRTHNLSSLVVMPTDYHHHRLFFRNIAYQQFLYQYDVTLSRLARQSLWFGYLPEGHPLVEQFRAKHGLSIRAFISIAFGLLAKFSDKKQPSVNRGWLLPYDKVFGSSVVESLLGALSVEPDDLTRVLRKNDKSKGGYQEFYEQTPFLRHPLIRNGMQYICVHPNVLFRSIEYFVHDTLKENSPNKFMDKFSTTIFETYMERSLRYSCSEYTPEREIAPFLPEGTKCVDFIIKSCGANLFVDAKAVEMPYLGMVSGDPETIWQRVESSALKAIEQTLSLNEAMLNKVVDQLPDFRGESYLLVVTTKELHLGNGRAFYEAIAKDRIEAIWKRHGESARLDLTHIHFLTIEEFDIMCAAVRSGAHNFRDIVKEATKDESEPSKQKFDFSQHIRSIIGSAPLPDFLESEANGIIDEFRGIV